MKIIIKVKQPKYRMRKPVQTSRTFRDRKVYNRKDYKRNCKE